MVLIHIETPDNKHYVFRAETITFTENGNFSISGYQGPENPLVTQFGNGIALIKNINIKHSKIKMY